MEQIVHSILLNCKKCLTARPTYVDRMFYSVWADHLCTLYNAMYKKADSHRTPGDVRGLKMHLSTPKWLCNFYLTDDLITLCVLSKNLLSIGPSYL